MKGNKSLPSLLSTLSQQVNVYCNVLRYHLFTVRSFSYKSNSFSFERFYTGTRFETEAKGNSCALLNVKEIENMYRVFIELSKHE